MRTLTIRLQEEDYKRLVKLSELRGESIAVEVRRAIKRELNRAGLLAEEEQKALQDSS